MPNEQQYPCTCGDTLGDVDPMCRAHFPSRYPLPRTYNEAQVREMVAKAVQSIRDSIIFDQTTGAADYGEAEEYAHNILRSAGYSPSGEALVEKV